MQVSIWEKESFFSEHDVIIVGSGLLGLWTAYEMKKNDPSLRITILEKHLIPTGASTRNAGFACYGSPSELLFDAELNGTDAMLELVEMRYKGIQKIKQQFAQKNIGWENCGGYEVYEDSPTLKKVNNHLDQLNDDLSSLFKNKHTFNWATDQMQSMRITNFAAMAENKDEAALHSGKLVQQLIQLVISSGVQILFNTEIKNWEETNNGIEIRTNHQSFITRKLLLATNAFTKSIDTGSTITPGRGQIIVTKPIPDLQLKGTFHYDEGFYYFRHLNNRLLLGGARNSDMENENTTSLDTSDIILNRLQKFLSEHLLKDQSFEIEYKWSGIMGFTENKQPQLKEIAPRIYSATACNGMGVALSPVFAEKIAAEILE